ncbi:hypothetical protein GCM10011507_14160 [Edaphobacter acidisoli]|uniref:Uncharacterized protein n=1 Tax=Edaphobacter acidisoli TaxID=2040573 RepID=A0A916RPD3_9BACT|nr:hypothetical protein GCM10011507_14160 [Edaphobacter acidisoli]
MGTMETKSKRGEFAWAIAALLLFCMSFGFQEKPVRFHDEATKSSLGSGTGVEYRVVAGAEHDDGA